MSLPNTYKQVEYIESSGTQYINLNINTSEVDRLQYSFEYIIIKMYNII